MVNADVSICWCLNQGFLLLKKVILFQECTLLGMIIEGSEGITGFSFNVSVRVFKRSCVMRAKVTLSCHSLCEAGIRQDCGLMNQTLAAQGPIDR